MKPNQLANVLIKIVGVYVSLCAIPGVCILVISLVGQPPLRWDANAFQMLGFRIGEVIQMAAGIWLIIRSRWVADHWFKAEDGDAKGTDNIQG